MNNELPRLLRGIIPYVQKGHNANSVKFAFCHVLKRSAMFNQIYLIDDIPNIETANRCRDYFIQNV